MLVPPIGPNHSPHRAYHDISAFDNYQQPPVVSSATTIRLSLSLSRFPTQTQTPSSSHSRPTELHVVPTHSAPRNRRNAKRLRGATRPPVVYRPAPSAPHFRQAALRRRRPTSPSPSPPHPLMLALALLSLPSSPRIPHLSRRPRPLRLLSNPAVRGSRPHADSFRPRRLLRGRFSRL